MPKLLLIAAAVVIATALTTAQRHLNSYEIPVKGTLTVTSNVVLGSNVLKEGIYNYRCDRHQITFTNSTTGKTVLKVPCEGRELPEPVEVTTMHVRTDPYGTRIVTKLLLKGSNIEHVFR